MKIVTDIDIDFADRDAALEELHHIPASRVQDGQLKKHNVGVYFHSAPTDPLTGFCSIPHKEAEERGYFKVDLLNLNIYKQVRDEAHMNELISTEPLWELLEDQAITDTLFQLNGHFDVVNSMKPRSIEQLAMVLAMIRPGKRHLIGKPWSVVEKDIWVVPADDAFVFKKAHSISYAMVLVVQMNLMLEEVLSSQPIEVPDECQSPVSTFQTHVA
jgi:hypothetical protein